MVFICITCGQEFNRRIKIEKKFIDLGSGRRHCLKCYPYHKERTKRKCKKCGNPIPSKLKIDGEIKIIRKCRLYCFRCSPFNTHSNGGKKLKIITNQKTKWSRKKRLEQKIKTIKYLGSKCIECGYDNNLATLEPHHKNPSEKEFVIGSRIMSWDKLKKELDKCELLCANCHREFHNPYYNKNNIPDALLNLRLAFD